MDQIKLAAFDLDNTLLDENHQLTADIRSAIKKLQANGITVVLATGRNFLAAAQYARELNLTAPIICFNGAMIRRLDRAKADYVSYLDEKLIREMVDFCHGRGLYLQMYDAANRIVVESVNEKTLADPDYYLADCVEVGDFTAVTAFHTPKMMIYDDPVMIETLYRQLRNRYEGRLYLAQSKDYLLEMMNDGVNKGAALSRLAAGLGLKRGQVLACGDNSNDAEMVAWAGYGVAVANATEKLKAAATYICEHPRNIGVIEALDRLIFNA